MITAATVALGVSPTITFFGPLRPGDLVASVYLSTTETGLTVEAGLFPARTFDPSGAMVVSSAPVQFVQIIDAHLPLGLRANPLNRWFGLRLGVGTTNVAVFLDVRSRQP